VTSQSNSFNHEGHEVHEEENPSCFYFVFFVVEALALLLNSCPAFTASRAGANDTF